MELFLSRSDERQGFVAAFELQQRCAEVNFQIERIFG